MLRRSSKIAIVGCDGIPNRYGGFETLASQLHSLSSNFVVISSSFKRSKTDRIEGNNVYIPVKSTGWSNVIYDSLSLIYASFVYKNVLVLGSTISPWLMIVSLFSRVTLNIGGIDWKRSKWNRIAKFVLRLAEAYSIKCAHRLVCDNLHIGKYLFETYGRQSEFIAYGTCTNSKVGRSSDSEDYFLSIARIQSDNNVHIVLEAFSNSKSRLKFIGNWNSCSYGIELYRKYSSLKNIDLIDAVYDQEVISEMRANSIAYIHPHSAGGTNPSLVEILPFGKVILAYSNGFNEETLCGQGYFWNTSEELSSLVEKLDSLVEFRMTKSIAATYDWQIITDKYMKICGT